VAGIADGLLAVDVGTSFTTGAVFVHGRVEPLELGDSRSQTPTVVAVTDDGDLVVGEAAERRATERPDAVARLFKRRVGDQVPVMLAGQAWPIESLLAAVLSQVAGAASRRLGTAPSQVVLTHPAGWGPFKLGVLVESAGLAGLPPPMLLPEPVAAAATYAHEGQVTNGCVAVYDLGGGTFDCAVVRISSDGFDIVGRPDGLSGVGGADVDEVVVGHVVGAVFDGEVDLDEVASRRLRTDCVAAKEALSFDARVSVHVDAAGGRATTSMVRRELEEMTRPLLSATVDVLERCIAGAHLGPGELSAVLLVGGASRMPLVAELVSSRLSLPVVVDAHPKLTIVRGALRAGARSLASASLAPPDGPSLDSPLPEPPARAAAGGSAGPAAGTALPAAAVSTSAAPPDLAVADAEAPPRLVDEEPTAARTTGPVTGDEPAADSAPEEVGPADRTDRVAGWLAAIGGLALLVAPYPTFLRHDGYVSKLDEFELYSFGAFVVFGLAAAAAILILRTRWRTIGRAVLVGLLPIVVSDVTYWFGEPSEQDDVVGPGAGWFVQVLGSAFVAAAGVIAAIRLRREVSLATPRVTDRSDATATGLAVAALLVGWLVTHGWAMVLSLSSGSGFWDASEPVRDLAFRLLLIGAVICALAPWLRGTVSPVALMGAITVALAICLGLFLADEEITGGRHVMVDISFFVLAVGAATVPPLATLVVPRQFGPPLLAAWAVGTAAGVPSYLARDLSAELLTASLVAAGVLAYVLLIVGRRGFRHAV
jgi:actin-like ATPase involved in cell morphogenesis